MSTETAAYLYSLLALRVLAEYDPYEFARTTAQAPGQIEDTIRRALAEDWRSESAQHEQIDIGDKLRELDTLERNASSPSTRSYLLRLLGQSALERAYQIALSLEQQGVLRGPSSAAKRHPLRPGKVTRDSEFTRLAVMRLLQDLPSYDAKFEHRLRDREIDCMLEPLEEGKPTILIEAKESLPDQRSLTAAAAQLTKFAAGWGKSALTVLITRVGEPAEFPSMPRRRGRPTTLLLHFDPEQNEFDSYDMELIRTAVSPF
jgi:hypothetical protein